MYARKNSLNLKPIAFHTSRVLVQLVTYTLKFSFRDKDPIYCRVHCRGICTGTKSRCLNCLDLYIAIAIYSIIANMVTGAGPLLAVDNIHGATVNSQLTINPKDRKMPSLGSRASLA